ncbi:MAG: nucleoside triphosphate pyrophosphohydrolase family protein [Clostridia bacterium]|nr:nucleoside triphosphate pyrophosphohydrolase family protein [Clostridia bacterium]
MELNEYQKLAMVTKKEWGNTNAELIDVGLGITGEAGEVSDLIKKYHAGVKELDMESLKLELGDVLWYVAEACDALNISIDEVANMNIEKLRKRHGDKFNNYGNRG